MCRITKTKRPLQTDYVPHSVIELVKRHSLSVIRVSYQVRIDKNSGPL